jgi:stress-induced morphogen
LNRPRSVRIEQILLQELSPSNLMIEDESHNHGAHREVRTANGAILHDHVEHPSTSRVLESHGEVSRRKSPETHFKVLIASSAFNGLSRVERQRKVHDLLDHEFKNGLHALTIRALTPDEFAKGVGEGFVSPSCANRVKKRE